MAWVRRHRLKALLLWTGLMLLSGVVIAAEAGWSLVNAQQACFFAYPNVPCPGGDDPAVARLAISLIGVPLVWGLGVGLFLLGRRARS